MWKSFKSINELESNGEKLVPPTSKQSWLLQFSNISNTLDLDFGRFLSKSYRILAEENSRGGYGYGGQEKGWIGHWLPAGERQSKGWGSEHSVSRWPLPTTKWCSKIILSAFETYARVQRYILIRTKTQLKLFCGPHPPTHPTGLVLPKGKTQTNWNFPWNVPYLHWKKFSLKVKDFLTLPPTPHPYPTPQFKTKFQICSLSIQISSVAPRVVACICPISKFDTNPKNHMNNDTNSEYHMNEAHWIDICGRSLFGQHLCFRLNVKKSCFEYFPQQSIAMHCGWSDPAAADDSAVAAVAAGITWWKWILGICLRLLLRFKLEAWANILSSSLWQQHTLHCAKLQPPNTCLSKTCFRETP